MRNIGKKIGLFGGTFDPVHIGHLIIADSVRELKNLDTVIFIPSASPPHKSRDIFFTADERYRMLFAAVQDDPGFIVSDVEMKRGGISFTIDTIREIKASLPAETELSFILGMDNLYELTTWKDLHEIVHECRLLVAKRVCNKSGEIPEWLEKNCEMIDVPLIGISSSDIRRRISKGKSIRHLVPDAVAMEIQNITIKSNRSQGI